jgi:hypothetical protein
MPRIVWATICGTVALLLVVLWVRSYRAKDLLTFDLGVIEFSLYSESGGFIFVPGTLSAAGGNWPLHWGSGRLLPDDLPPNFNEHPFVPIRVPQVSWIVFIPFWALLLVSTALGSLSFFPLSTLTAIPAALQRVVKKLSRTRFSLRAAIIMMTLVAVAMGALVIALRR